MLLGCDRQISGGLDSEPCTATISLRCSPSITGPSIFVAVHRQDVSNGSRGHYLTKDGELSKRLQPPQYISFAQAVCAPEENLLTLPKLGRADGSKSPPCSE